MKYRKFADEQNSRLAPFNEDSWTPYVKGCPKK